MDEVVLEPELPIVDPHHHLWAARPLLELPDGRPSKRPGTYLFEDLLADLNSGHDIRATVFIDARAMYRADGPEDLRALGETEFVNGVAAMAASGLYGQTRVAAGIVSRADFCTGDRVAEVLEAHRAITPRFKGVRQTGTHDIDPSIAMVVQAPEHLYLSPDFQEGFRHLGRLGLSFDAFVFGTQLGDVAGLAMANPETTIILNHAGTPLGIGAYAGTRETRFPAWRASILALAKSSPNLYMKLGGLGMQYCSFPSFAADPPASSEQLAEEWRPYLETCIEAFGVDRCMFESNFPVDLDSGSYLRVWNAFKRIAAGYSADEKTALFSRSATTAYSLEY